MQAGHLFLGGALAVLVAGCSWTRDYPEGWDPLPEPRSADCRDFAGRYGNHGEPGGGRAALTRYFFEDWSLAAATHVSLAPEAGGDWQVTAWKGESRLASRTFAAGSEARCEKGALVIDGPWELAGSRGGIGRVDLTTEFHLAGRYLVAHAKELLRGLAAIVPVRATLRSWYRFPIQPRAAQPAAENR